MIAIFASLDTILYAHWYQPIPGMAETPTIYVSDKFINPFLAWLTSII